MASGIITCYVVDAKVLPKKEKKYNRIILKACLLMPFACRLDTYSVYWRTCPQHGPSPHSAIGPPPCCDVTPRCQSIWKHTENTSFMSKPQCVVLATSTPPPTPLLSSRTKRALVQATPPRSLPSRGLPPGPEFMKEMLIQYP